MTGMEPVLQILIALLVVFVAGRIIGGEAPAIADKAWLLTLAPLVTGVRFEGMFLIVAIGVMLLLQKRWVYAVAFCVLGFLPVAVYGNNFGAQRVRTFCRIQCCSSRRYQRSGHPQDSSFRFAMPSSIIRVWSCTFRLC